MKKYTLLLLLLFAFLLAACNGDEVEDEPTPRPTPTIEEADPTPDNDGYPAPPTQPASGGYPVEAAEGWVIRPAGEQCADNLAYPSADSAVADLEAAGVTVLAVEETELVVCEACGCPTSTHYRALIAGEDMVTAFSLGWQREQ